MDSRSILKLLKEKRCGLVDKSIKSLNKEIDVVCKERDSYFKESMVKLPETIKAGNYTYKLKNGPESHEQEYHWRCLYELNDKKYQDICKKEDDLRKKRDEIKKAKNDEISKIELDITLKGADADVVAAIQKLFED